MPEITIRISDRVLKATLVVVPTIALLSALSYFGSLDVFRSKCQVKMFVPEVQGIAVGGAVKLDGIPVGSVSKIQLANNSADPNRRIELELRIEKRFQDMIRSDSTASLVTEGLLGDRYVNIERGFAGPRINSGEEVRTAPVREVHFTDFVNALGRWADCLNAEKNVPKSESRSGANKPSPSQHVNP